MSRRPDWEARTRMRFLVRLAGATVASFLLATAAAAAISSITPDRGTVEPGGSTSANFTVTGSLTSCFTADAPSGFSVAFDGLGLNLLPAGCALGGARVTMTVTAGANASAGDYRVTITETAVGGRLLDTHEWPFTVPAPVTTTTTIPETTTTTRPRTTTTAALTTTSTQSGATTSTDRATTTTSGATTGGATETTTAGAAATGNNTPTASPATKTTVSDTPNTGGGDSPPAGEEADTLPEGSPDGASEEADDPEVLAAGSSDGDLPYERYPAGSGDDAPEVLSRTVFSDQLRSQFSQAVPLTLADAVLSPVVIAEFLFRSLLQSAMSLLVPVLIATLVGSWIVWRMREEVDDDELAISRQSMG